MAIPDTVTTGLRGWPDKWPVPFETPDLLPAEVDVPMGTAGEGFVVRPLRIGDAELDHETVLANRERLRGTFGPGHEWPAADLTLEGNRIDVAWHHKEFQRRDAFTYAVFTPDETVELGCLYLQPTTAPDYDVAVYYWLAATADERGLAETIESHLRDWVADAWPFDRVAYPGRDIPWAEWEPATDD